jgi:hypothetical protein
MHGTRREFSRFSGEVSFYCRKLSIIRVDEPKKWGEIEKIWVKEIGICDLEKVLVASEKLLVGLVASEKVLVGLVASEKVLVDLVASEKVLVGLVASEKVLVDLVASEKVLVGLVASEKVLVGLVASEKLLVKVSSLQNLQLFNNPPLLHYPISAISITRYASPLSRATSKIVMPALNFSSALERPHNQNIYDITNSNTENM